MAGFGNRTAPDYVAENMTDQHDSTRFDRHTSVDAYSDAHPKYGSGATGGAGFGTSIYPLLPPPTLPFNPPHPLHIASVYGRCVLANPRLAKATNPTPLAPQPPTTNSASTCTRTRLRIAVRTRVGRGVGVRRGRGMGIRRGTLGGREVSRSISLIS